MIIFINIYKMVALIIKVNAIMVIAITLCYVFLFQYYREDLLILIVIAHGRL